MPYILYTLTVQDMISDEFEIEAIVEITRFKTLIEAGVSIESIKLVDIDQYVDGQSIISMCYVDVVIGGHTYNVCMSFDSDELLKAILQFSHSIDAQRQVTKYFQ